MPRALIVTKRVRGDDKWVVYLHEDRIRQENEVISPLGPTVGSVSSWEELEALAVQNDADELDGDGVDEMEEELGPRPGGD
jgi:hypothetical protein